MTLFAFILAAYLLGSISFALVASKLFGLPDPRTYGSKNIGATNVLRSGKKAAAAFTLLGDAGKGALAVALAQYFNLGEMEIAAIALAVFCGHLFPIFLRFRGGKGVATALGILLTLHLMLGLAVLATWIAVAAIWRYSSLAAIVATLAAPAYAWYFLGAGFAASAVLAMSMLILWRHQRNIQNLLAGTESKMGKAP